ncbi:DNA alkylation repair protein [Candidatus Bipolaricaulota bacterium]|nr:DNA alkylation repair protein [Candidatus Bipolaricaulota bacterium]
MEESLIAKIESELLEMVDEDYKEDVQNYFNNEIDNYGVRTGEVRKLARRYYGEIKNRPKEDIFEVCEELLETGISENRTIAFQWAHKLKAQYETDDFSRFEGWVERYVNNWGACDDLCTHALGELVYQYPDLIENLKNWCGSDNSWKRRGAAVTMIYSIMNGEVLDETLEIADLLFSDEEDLVQKGYGWTLKEASKDHPRAVFDYVMDNKKEMPRTSLRYAIEKLPEDWQDKAMDR